MMTLFRLLAAALTRKVSIWKTLRLNFCCLPLRQAVRLPLYVYRNTLIRALKTRIILDVPAAGVSQGMVHLGYEYEASFQRTVIGFYSGTVVFKGALFISRGTRLMVFGLLEFGPWSGTSFNAAIGCYHHIRLGAHNLIGYESMITDSDNHPMLVDGVVTNYNSPIVFGDHNWIASRVVILKGSVLGSNNVVGIGSILNRDFPDSHQLIAGNPARVVKTGLNWDEEFPDGDRLGNPPGFTVPFYQVENQKK